VVGQHRSTQRLAVVPPSEEEAALRAWLRAFSTERPRWGWRRAATQAGKEGWVVNNKRIQRLWRQEGLKVPYRKRKKPLRGIGSAVGAMCPIAPNALWALDFQFETTVDGRTLKLLSIVNEFIRECPAIVVDRSIDADKVVTTLDRLLLERGAPAFVRFDNGPEFIAYAVADWCRFNGVGSIFIDPGSPRQNAWIESINGPLNGNPSWLPFCSRAPDATNLPSGAHIPRVFISVSVELAELAAIEPASRRRGLPCSR
jgi:putative transposase